MHVCVLYVSPHVCIGLPAAPPSFHRKRKRSKNDGGAPDTNKTLGVPPKKGSLPPRNRPETPPPLLPIEIRKQQERELSRRHGGKFLGIKWGMPGYATNTCPLDSFLMMMYLPHKLELLFTPYPELKERNSLLSRSFALLDQNRSVEARQLWIEELYGISITPSHEGPGVDLFDSTEIFRRFAYWKTERYQSSSVECHALARKVAGDHPLKKTFEWMQTMNGKCIHEPKCQGHTDEEVEIPLTLRMKLRTNCQCTSERTTPTQILDSHLSDGLRQSCTGVFVDENGKLKNCSGPTLWDESKVVRWPHTMIFTQFGVTRNGKLEDWPEQFTYREKRFVLRGATLCSHSHFRSSTKVDGGWISFDGLWQNCNLFRFHTGGNTIMENGTYNLDTLIYEVLNPRQTAFFKRKLNFRDKLV